jgi:hypothetical protein
MRVLKNVSALLLQLMVEVLLLAQPPQQLQPATQQTKCSSCPHESGKVILLTTP